MSLTDICGCGPLLLTNYFPLDKVLEISHPYSFKSFLLINSTFDASLIRIFDSYYSSLMIQD